MQSSRPRPLYLGFSSQKGGVGKSTLAEILSSMLYYEVGISLFVVDCDLTQDSFFKLREREKGTIGEDSALTAYMQAYFHKLQRRSYRIIKARPQEALAPARAQEAPSSLHDQGSQRQPSGSLPRGASQRELPLEQVPPEAML